MLVGHVDNSAYPQITVDIQLALTTPAKARGPVPVIMEFGFTSDRSRHARPGCGAPAPQPAHMAAAGAREGLGLRRSSYPAVFRPTMAPG